MRYSAGSTGQQLWRDTRRDPLASYSGIPAGCSAGSTGGLDYSILGGIHASSSGGILGGIHWRAALAGYSAGSTGEQLWRDTWWGSTGEPLWRDTRRDPLASSSGGRDTRRDPLASCSGGILGGSTGELLWRDTRRDEPLWRDTRRDPWLKTHLPWG